MTLQKSLREPEEILAFRIRKYIVWQDEALVHNPQKITCIRLVHFIIRFQFQLSTILFLPFNLAYEVLYLPKVIEVFPGDQTKEMDFS